MTATSSATAFATAAQGAPFTEQAVELDRVWSLFLWIAVAVGLLVAALLAWILVRYRRGRQPELPVQQHYNIPLEVLYTVLPLLLVIGLFVVSVDSINKVDKPGGEPDLVVQVTAFQWQWQFDYPAGQARSGSEGDANPELVLPADSSVRLELTSPDVLHSFWIPSARFKRDIFPGETTAFQIDVTAAPGVYPDAGVCAEFCGLDHHKMRFDVRVLPQAEFDAWLVEHRIAAATAAAPDAGDGS